MTRIIAGSARGRTLVVPPSGTRPTSDRAREGLFNSLDARFGFYNIVALDLYAGSGALGLEAASRGAQAVHLVERHDQACAIIRKNAHVVPDTNIHVHHMSASTYVTQAPTNTFDMVFADPPYELPDNDVTELLTALRPALKDGAVVVIERHVDSPETHWPEGLEPTGQKLKKRTYGIARMDVATYTRKEH